MQLIYPSLSHAPHSPGSAKNTESGARSWQGTVATVESATNWKKNQMQFSPSKFCFERRTHFMRITDIRVAVLDCLGNRRWLLLFNSSYATVLSCASLCQIAQ